MPTTDHIQPGDEFYGWMFMRREIEDTDNVFVFAMNETERKITLSAQDGWLKLMQILRNKSPIYV